MAEKKTIMVLRRLWNRSRSNYWFVPTLIIAGLSGLAYLMLTLDVLLPQKLILHLGWVYTRDAGGARALLSVISQSMITVAGVVFSITVVALTLASNQFGTRVLKSFARDTGNQVVLGTFLGTFLYCLLVMRRVESEHQSFVPSMSVAVGIFLAMAGVVVLVYFIHHVIMEIQAENVLAAVTEDLYSVIDFLFPEQVGRGDYSPQPTPQPHMDGAGMQEVCPEHEGFIRSIDSEELLRLAKKHDALIEILLLPGAFATPKSVIARFRMPDNRNDKKEFERHLRRSVDIGRYRTHDQDLGFAFEQLGLVAVRSLSPAINAMGTAKDAMEWLKSALIRLGDRMIPSGHRYDEKNRLRVITATWDLSELLHKILDPIRQNSQDQPDFVLHAVEVLAEAARASSNPVLSTALEEHIRKFGDAAAGFRQELDKRRVRLAVARVLRERRSA